MNKLGYLLKIFDTNKDLIAIRNDGVSLDYRSIFMGVGNLIWVVEKTDPIVAQLDKDYLIVCSLVYEMGLTKYNLQGSGVYDDFYGLYQSRQVITGDDGTIYYALVFSQLEDLLRRRINAFPSGISAKTDWPNFDPIDICEDLIQNSLDDAFSTTSNGRDRTAGSPYDLTVTTYGFATAISKTVLRENIFDSVRSICDANNVDFYITPNFPFTAITAYVTARYNPFSIALNRASFIYFATSLDNVANATLGQMTEIEKTVAIVGGQGKGANREISVRTSTNYSTPTNEYEVFVDARNKESGELDTLGDIALAATAPRFTIDMQYFRSEGYEYKFDYDKGDLISVVVDDVIYSKRIMETICSFSTGSQPKVSFVLEDDIS